MLGVVAMGLSHAVFLVQVLHEWILRAVSRMRAAAVPREWGLRPLEALSRVLAGVRLVSDFEGFVKILKNKLFQGLGKI